MLRIGKLDEKFFKKRLSSMSSEVVDPNKFKTYEKSLDAPEISRTSVFSNRFSNSSLL